MAKYIVVADFDNNEPNPARPNGSIFEKGFRKGDAYQGASAKALLSEGLIRETQEGPSSEPKMVKETKASKGK